MSGFREYLAGENDGPGGKSMPMVMRNVKTGQEYPITAIEVHGILVHIKPLKMTDPLPVRFHVIEEGERVVEGEVVDQVPELKGTLEHKEIPTPPELLCRGSRSHTHIVQVRGPFI